MSAALIRAGRMSRAERTALHGLRIGAFAAAPSDVPIREMAALAHAAAAQGYEIRPTQSGFTSPDETKLVGWLAAYQRDGASHFARADEKLAPMLASAAAALAAVGCRLSYKSILRADLVGGQPLPPLEPVTPVDRRSGRLAALRAQPLPTDKTKRARILSFVRSKGRATTAEICSLGTTRQYISALHREGYLHRVGYGVYAIAETNPQPIIHAHAIEIVESANGKRRYRAQFTRRPQRGGSRKG